MSTLGQQLLQPESGWKRYNFTQLPFDFISDKWEVLSYSEAYGGEVLMFPAKISPQSLKFKFYGDRIRILIRADSSYSPSTTIKIDDITYSMANNYNCGALFNIIGFEKIFENGNKWREVEIITGKDGYNYLFNVILDAIDINKDGFVKSLLFLIKQNSKYYSINSNFLNLGQPIDNTQLENWYNKYGSEDINIITQNLNNKEFPMSKDENGIWKTDFQLDMNNITDNIDLVGIDENNKSIKYDCNNYRILDLCDDEFDIMQCKKK